MLNNLVFLSKRTRNKISTILFLQKYVHTICFFYINAYSTDIKKDVIPLGFIGISKIFQDFYQYSI